jgi:hypothetical protein
MTPLPVVGPRPTPTASRSAGARILSALRGWFRRHGFLEVVAGAAGLPGSEAHLHAFATELTPRRRRTPPPHTAPEFACKALAAGESGSSPHRVFAIASTDHCIVELPCWNGTDQRTLRALMDDCAAILVRPPRPPAPALRWKDRPPTPTPPRLLTSPRRSGFAASISWQRWHPPSPTGRARRRGAHGRFRPPTTPGPHLQPRAGQRIEPRLGLVTDAARSISDAGGGVSRPTSTRGPGLRALRRGASRPPTAHAS